VSEFCTISYFNESHPLLPFKKCSQDKGYATKDNDESDKGEFTARARNATDVYAE